MAENKPQDIMSLKCHKKSNYSTLNATKSQLSQKLQSNKNVIKKS